MCDWFAFVYKWFRKFVQLPAVAEKAPHCLGKTLQKHIMGHFDPFITPNRPSTHNFKKVKQNNPKFDYSNNPVHARSCNCR